MAQALAAKDQWYVVHVLSGQENKVKDNIEKRVKTEEMTDVTGTVKLPDGVEMVMPGANVAIEVELITPIAMEKTIRFAIREGGKTVGAGRVSEILD